jgi:ribosomal protein L34E
MADDTRTASGYQRGEWSTKADYRAECQTCGWTLHGRNAQGPGAIHARKHKHCVRVEVETARIYNHEGA